jgi:hypothetical protein
MECVLVWEFILLCRKQQAELAIIPASYICERELQVVVKERIDEVNRQCLMAEKLLKQAHMPMLHVRPTVNGNNLVFDGHFIVATLLHMTKNRIRALSYIMRSQISNEPLRQISAEWLHWEIDLLEKQVQYACTSPLDALNPV